MDLAGFLLRRPVLVFSGLLLSAVCSLALARNLKFDFTPQSIYRGNDELLAYSEQFKQTFGYDEAVLLVVVQATEADDALSVASLQWQADVAAALKSIPGVIRIDAVPTIEVPRFSLGGPVLEPLIGEPEVDGTTVERVRSTLAGSDVVKGGLLSVDERLATLAVFLDPTVRDIDPMRNVVMAVREALERHPPPDGFRALLSGLPELRVEVVDDLAKDMATLIPMGGVVYLIVLALMFRRASGALLPLFAVGIGLTWTLATFAVLGDSLNLVSNVLPILLMIIGVSSCVQIVTCYAEQSAGGLDRRTAAQTAIAKMAAPCFLAAVTTAVGFASLFTARSVILNRFGWQAAIGIGFQYVSTLLTLGALFRFFQAPTYVGTSEAQPGLLTRTVTMLGYAVARHPRVTMICAAAVLGLAVWSGSYVQINSYAIGETFPESHPSMQTLRLLDRELSGIMPLEVSLTAREPDAFLQPDVFHRVVRVEHAAAQQPGVSMTQSYADLIREVLRAWPGRRRNESDEALVPLSEVGAERLERTHRFLDRFAEAFHYDSFLTSDGTRARIRMRLREIGSRETLAIIDSLRQTLSQEFPPDGPIQAQLTGEGYVNALALTILIRDLFYSLLTASLVIFTLIAFEFRSLRAGLIAALPNLTPLAVTLGYMGLRGYEMNVANVIAFTICLGLADDNTIYFLYRFRQEMEHTHQPTEAVRRAFLGTGRAIVLTSVLLLVGMSVLLWSDFVPTRRFAELTSVTILGNLLGVLLLLPACLVLFWKQPAGQTGQRELSNPAEALPFSS